MKRTGFARKVYVPPPAAPLRRVERSSVLADCSGATEPQTKTEPKRNPLLTSMARGMPCLLRIPDVCNGDKETTVACHSNLSIHGKAGARKADDQYTVWGCSACHGWLDRGPAAAATKEAAFMSAHLRQVEAWRGIARFDPFLRDKFAAEWALEMLGATPVGDEP